MAAGSIPVLQDPATLIAGVQAVANMATLALAAAATRDTQTMLQNFQVQGWKTVRRMGWLGLLYNPIARLAGLPQQQGCQLRPTLRMLQGRFFYTLPRLNLLWLIPTQPGCGMRVMSWHAVSNAWHCIWDRSDHPGAALRVLHAMPTRERICWPHFHLPQPTQPPISCTVRYLSKCVTVGVSVTQHAADVIYRGMPGHSCYVLGY